MVHQVRSHPVRPLRVRFIPLPEVLLPFLIVKPFEIGGNLLVKRRYRSCKSHILSGIAGIIRKEYTHIDLSIAHMQNIAHHSPIKFCGLCMHISHREIPCKSPFHIKKEIVVPSAGGGTRHHVPINHGLQKSDFRIRKRGSFQLL